MSQYCASKLCDQWIKNRKQNQPPPIQCPLCKIVNYCSPKCREEDWLNHKIVCIQSAMSQATTLKQMRRTPDEFEVVNQGGNLGRGSYGQVKLVRDKTNGLLYAMKIMVKKEIFEYCSVENLKREIRIQKKLDHPHVTKLFHYFEDKDQVYLILEFAQNGSLFGHLRRCKKFPENEAFVYFFQTCLGIDYLHKKNIIHRDLKPENLLLDESGNIKICDFGWSAENYGPQQKRTTFCGTVDYMAPEMIENKPHDYTLDVWCLGILLYELLHGYAPFRGRNDIEKCNNIVARQKIDYAPFISADAKNLIEAHLRYKASERIQMNKIFKHPWMVQMSKAYSIDIPSYIYVEPDWKFIRRKNFSFEQSSDQQFSQPSTNNTKESLSRTMLMKDEPKDSFPPSNSSEEHQIYKTRVSKVSKRNWQEIVPPQDKKDIGMFDKFLMSLGCMKRE